MRRTRAVAASPARNAGEAWAVITSLIADSLDKASDIERTDVEAVLGEIGGIGRMLISTGLLESEPLVLRAAALDLEITVVSGDKALGLEENLASVPGAAAATDWKLYLPAREPHEQSIRAAAKGSPHLSDVDPPASSDDSTEATASAVDREALERWANET